MGRIEEASDDGSSVDSGSIYRALARLVTDGLIVETDAGDPLASRPRRVYRLSASGRRILAAEPGRLGALIDQGRQAGLDPELG